jgi:hypothetical protein
MPRRTFGCWLLEIGGVDSHQGLRLPANPTNLATAPLFSHSNHGFSVARAGTNPSDYSATMHLWTDGFSGIFSRVVYILAEPVGGDCSMPNVSRVP